MKPDAATLADIGDALGDVLDELVADGVLDGLLEPSDVLPGCGCDNCQAGLPCPAGAY